MREIIFEPDAHQEYKEWENKNSPISRKIDELILDIQRDPFKGIGKPEPLKYYLKGCWSRRIDQKNRLIYRITQDAIHIVSCKDHYD